MCFALRTIILLVFGIWAESISSQIKYLSGSTEKIEQLVGDYDRQLEEPTQNLTQSTYNIWGTDLGVSFRHEDTTIYLFGDIPGDQGLGVDRDPVAYSLDTTPEDGIELMFYTQNSGQYNPITIPGISQGAFEVPQDGFSLDGWIYLFHSTDAMTRSVLAKSGHAAKDFQLIESNFSTLYFINISAEWVERKDYPGLPGNSDRGLLLFGTGQYRKSAIYLAYMPADSIEHKSATYYYSGSTDSRPHWSHSEAEAKPIISVNCGGELSAVYNDQLKKWMVIFACDQPRGVQIRFAETPWGEFSDPLVVFDPDRDGGYCEFMHANWTFRNCDNVHDPGRENEWGGEYAPYLINHLSYRVDSLVVIYYTLSTWNPYTVVLMKSTLVDAIEDPTTQNTSIIEKSNISIHPNPIGNAFKINGTFSLWTLLDAYGSQIAKGNEPLGDVSMLPAGMYFLQVDQQLFKLIKL